MTELVDDPVPALDEYAVLVAAELRHGGWPQAERFFLQLQRHLADYDDVPAGETYDRLLRGLQHATIASINLARIEAGVTKERFLADTTPFVRQTFQQFLAVRRREICERANADPSSV